jgi:hypothetical protein
MAVGVAAIVSMIGLFIADLIPGRSARPHPWLVGGHNSSIRKKAAEMSDVSDLEKTLTVHGTHHFSLIGRAPAQAQLDNSVWKAEELIGKAGATIGRYDSKALMAAFYAQVPGNARWRVRRGGVPLSNFADGLGFDPDLVANLDDSPEMKREVETALIVRTPLS